MEDLEALERWRQGDRAAGDLLFSRHVDSLFRFFRSKLDDASAEDVTQATFLACVKGKESFRADSSFRTYLFAVARNQLLMHYRGRGRAERVVELDRVSAIELAPDWGASPSTMLRASDEQRIVREALQRIPVDFQIAVELYYWEGMSTAAIAEVLEVAEGTVRSRLTRARERISEIIQEKMSDRAAAERTIEGLDGVVGSLGAIGR
jgi:RNA polymerase sigma factor (sigma-70 family)